MEEEGGGGPRPALQPLEPSRRVTHRTIPSWTSAWTAAGSRPPDLSTANKWSPPSTETMSTGGVTPSAKIASRTSSGAAEHIARPLHDQRRDPQPPQVRDPIAAPAAAGRGERIPEDHHAGKRRRVGRPRRFVGSQVRANPAAHRLAADEHARAGHLAAGRRAHDRGSEGGFEHRGPIRGLATTRHVSEIEGHDRQAARGEL